jgi:hypothetical protein
LRAESAETIHARSQKGSTRRRPVTRPPHPQSPGSYVGRVLLAMAMRTPTFLIAWTIATAAAILVFLHANKRGSRHSTAWGISVFLALGLALPVYVVHARRHKPSGRRY